MPNQRLYRLSDPELHQQLGLKEKSLRRLVAAGQLPARKVLNTLMISESDIDSFLDGAP